MIVIRSARARRLLKWLVPFVLIPLAVLLGATVFSQRLHMIVSLGVAVLALVLFLTGFERKTTGSRQMVLISVMTALCIVGRFIPLFKPITALTILTAMYFGGESGFLVGALAALLSNFSFGQGPWTPFQMLAWGMIGLVAGFLAEPLKRSKALLLGYGLVSGAAYSLIMDVWTVLWYGGQFDPGLYAGAVAASLPHMLVYSLSNLVFLHFMARPFGEKLERVHIKYGI